MQTPTSDQIRSRIDQGLTGEKVSMPDPAAAPLGTDAEAAGAPPTVKERALDANHSPQMPEQARIPPSGILVYLLVVGVVVCALAFVVFLALQ